MKYLLLLIPMLFPGWLSAQEENNYWAFGHGAGLDFNQNPPAFFQTPLQCWEGGSIFFSDASGNKLFYSNGNQVWNANNSVMPNGSGLEGNGAASAGFPCSSAQGTVAAQSVANPDQYYLFVLDAVEDVPPYGLGKLRYSVVDMSLNGGLGDVVVTEKNIVLEDSLCEKMTLIPGEGCYYWLIVHHITKPLYYAFKIDAGGIDPVPVVSVGLLPGEVGVGMMSVSPDGRRIALSNAQSGFEIGFFDKSNGMVSNVGAFASTSQIGMSSHCFSPDNTKLYLCRSSRLLQYDATLFPNVAALETSAIEIANGSNAPFGYMRRGPDNKIYIASFLSGFLSVINNPDDGGLSCNYDFTGIALPPSAQFPNPLSPQNPYYGLGVGQSVLSVDALIGRGESSLMDTLVCPGTRLDFTVSSDRDHYIWNTGNTTNTLTVEEPGIYWVHSWKACKRYADTFIVDMVVLNDWTLGNDTTICPGTTIILDAANATISSYTWQDGSTDASYTVNNAGTYFVEALVNGCAFSDTIQVEVYNPYVRIEQSDTTVCDGQELILNAIAWPGSSYQWSDGSTNAQMRVAAPGTYAVEATNICGTYTDSVRVTMIACDCRNFVPNAFSPNADGNNDVFQVRISCPQVEVFLFDVFNRYGQRIFHAESPDQFWDGTFNGKTLDAGVYYYFLRYKGRNHDITERKGDITLVR